MDKKCYHKINVEESSLIQLNQLTMEYPPKLFYVCKICGEPFEFDFDKSKQKGGQTDITSAVNDGFTDNG